MGPEMVRPWLKRVHVFHWEPGGTRQPLVQGAKRWIPYLRLLRSSVADGYASIEYICDDSPQAFCEDARTLNSWFGDTVV